MAPLREHKDAALFKFIYIGDSSVGKTGSLVSLVKAGYKLRILDLDNGVGTLRSYAMKECPDQIDNVDSVTVRDKIKLGVSAIYGGKSGPVIDGQPKAFTQGLALMEKWDDGSVPSEWGPDYIFVLDSLSAYGKAALAWATGLNPSAKDPRQWFFAAQKGVEDTIALLTSEAFNTNVIIISHVNYKEVGEGNSKGYVNAIGSALGPIIPRYFNTLVMAESVGFGKMTKRKIKTMPTGVVDLKTPVSHTIESELPLETGLATLVETMKKAATGETK